MRKVIITGSLGQIGSELTERLRHELGTENVLATDLRYIEGNSVVEDGLFEQLDVNDFDHFLQLAHDHEADTIIHLASLLSATAEARPMFAWHLNMEGLINALEVARTLGPDMKVFTASSIAAFGPNTPKDHTPQDTIMRPSTMYGITKVAGELLSDYYYTKYGVDTRSLRFPGLISYKVKPGGGTTDYAVDIYYEALSNSSYTSFIDKNTYMDMMYMDDAIDAIVDLLNAKSSQLKHRNAYNITGMSFDPEEIAASIKVHLPHFEMRYEVDTVRQAIAESWPNSLDDSVAREEWGFNPKYDLADMTAEMLFHIGEQLSENTALV